MTTNTFNSVCPIVQTRSSAIAVARKLTLPRPTSAPGAAPAEKLDALSAATDSNGSEINEVDLSTLAGPGA